MTKAAAQYLKRLASNILAAYMSANYYNTSVYSSEYQNAQNTIKKELDRIITMYGKGLITENEATKYIAKFAA